MSRTATFAVTNEGKVKNIPLTLPDISEKEIRDLGFSFGRVRGACIAVGGEDAYGWGKDKKTSRLMFDVNIPLLCGGKDVRKEMIEFPEYYFWKFIILTQKLAVFLSKTASLLKTFSGSESRVVMGQISDLVQKDIMNIHKLFGISGIKKPSA